VHGTDTGSFPVAGFGIGLGYHIVKVGFVRVIKLFKMAVKIEFLFLPKHRYPITMLHGATTQKTMTCIFTAMKT